MEIERGRFGELIIGPDPVEAAACVVGVHGRDQSAEYMQRHLVEPIDRDDVCWILPSATRGCWYSGRAADPLVVNESELVLSLGVLDRILAPLPLSKTVLVGFSQGGCLVAEYLARRAPLCAGAAMASGTLLGPAPAGRVALPQRDALPVYIGAGSGDTWMSVQQAKDTVAVFERSGAIVSSSITETLEHAIHEADLRSIAAQIEQVRHPSETND